MSPAVRHQRKRPLDTLHPKEVAQHFDRNWLGGLVIDQGGQGEIVGRIVHPGFKRVQVFILGRGDVDGEKPTGKASGLHPRQVEMPRPFAVQPKLFSVGAGAGNLQDDVVVTIEDGNGRRHDRLPAG